MKKNLRTIASAMVMFTMVMSAFAAPFATANAVTQTSGSSSGTSFSIGGGSSSNTSCSVTASSRSVKAGEKVTIKWETSGFSKITINGETVSGSKGEKTYYNIQVETTFKLVATNDSGTSSCNSTVTVGCEQAPVDVKCTLTATLQTIAYGGKVTLNWTSQGGEGVIFNNGIGNKPANGSMEVGPLYKDTTYILTVDEGLVVSPHQSTKCTAVI
ncbi:hypothetical protein KC730_02275, partial [Candidatus Kaiserbacteria bacterium]|nr:hypothetical protein [Candidatus Kaiserbacteria bacterium]